MHDEISFVKQNIEFKMRYNGGIGHCRSKCAEAPHTGTTIVACVYKDGVVLGSDGRVSVGNYISNRASNKIAALADHVFLLRSGSAPDAQLVSDHGENMMKFSRGYEDHALRLFFVD